MRGEPQSGEFQESQEATLDGEAGVEQLEGCVDYWGPGVNQEAVSPPGPMLSNEQMDVWSRLSHSVRRFYPGLSQEQTQQVVQDAFVRADMEYGLAEAAEWAQGFKIPEHLLERDVARLRDAGGCIKEVARRLFLERRSSRLNLTRVFNTISADNP